MSNEQERLERFRERYLENRVPWADVEPPPEVKELVGELTPGRALTWAAVRSGGHLSGFAWLDGRWCGFCT
ncbi:MAG: hypothetical protein R3C44_05570 [Chloroflexota bacterium]